MLKELDKQLQIEQPRKYKWVKLGSIGTLWVISGFVLFALSFKELGKYIIYSGFIYTAFCTIMCLWVFVEEWVKKKSREEENSI
jgi:hypothetical protein